MAKTPRKRLPGRPTKLTPEVRTVILHALRAGNTLTTAAHFAGIDPDTLRAWMDRGEADVKADASTEFSGLFGAIKKGMAEAVARNVRAIQRASLKTWTAAAWWLERREPQEWGKPVQRVHFQTPQSITFLIQHPDGTTEPLGTEEGGPRLPSP